MADYAVVLLAPPVTTPPVGQPAIPGPWIMVGGQSSGVPQSAPMGGWLAPIPPGATAAAVAQALVSTLQVPTGTEAYVVDLSGTPDNVAVYTLTAQWTPTPTPK